MTSQVRKQYDGYACFFLEKLCKIVNYIVVPCSLVIVWLMILVDHFFQFVRDLGLDLNLLLALGINDPNVNNSFKSKLAKELQKRGAAHFLDVVTCSIHIANNAFSEGIKCLKNSVKVDQFPIDLHFFVKLSATRREDYRGVSESTDVTMHYVIKHFQTNWLSLDKVLGRIIEQYENLKEYF